MVRHNTITRLIVFCGIFAVGYGAGSGQTETVVRYDGGATDAIPSEVILKSIDLIPQEQIKQNIPTKGRGDETLRYQLWRVTPHSSVELEVLDFLVAKHNLSVWRHPSSIGRPVDVLVAPTYAEELVPYFNTSFTSFKVLQRDIQPLIDNQLSKERKQDEKFNYSKYHKLDEILEWINNIVSTYGDLATKHDIGKSYESRPLTVLKISSSSKNSVNGTAEKPGIFLQGGIHAREWISPATVIYMTNQLLEQYDTSSEVKKLVDYFDWYILPVLNVDGYEYTWTNDRLWRKTRSRNHGSRCRGTDPNRNWDNHFGEARASDNPCDETFRGSRAFSEIEVRTVADFLRSRRFLGFIDFHSYGQLWMTSWGWTEDLPPDFKIQNAQSAASVKALEAVHGTPYSYGTIANTLYLASGYSVDWAYEQGSVFYAATAELRDRGEYGFLLPEDQIIPCGEETFEGLKAYAQFIIDQS